MGRDGVGGGVKGDDPRRGQRDNQLSLCRPGRSPGSVWPSGGARQTDDGRLNGARRRAGPGEPE